MLATVRSLKAVQSPPAETKAASERGQSTVRERLWFVAREPFFQFIVLGFLIWTAIDYWNAHHDRHTVHLGRVERQRIVSAYLQQFGQPPTPEQLRGLIDRFVREEIFLREGFALNLQKDDEIVRRRIVQKYEFLQTDLRVPDSPGPGVLERWFEQNKLRYLTPDRIAFAHVYFSADRVGDIAAKARAGSALMTLRLNHTSRASDLGDGFPGPSDVNALAPDDAARLFGRSELSEQLFKAPVGQWVGPYRSGYGWHLIYVTGHFPSVLPPLSEIRDRVLADFMDEERRVLNEQGYEKLRAQYTVDGDGPDP